MPIPLLRALTQRDFALLWVGQTISMFGDGIFTVALAWQALETSSAATLGLVLLIRSLTRVALLLVGGALSDRYQRRLLMLAGDAIQMVAVGALAYVAATGEVQVWQLALVAVASGAGSALFLSSSAALVPDLVDEDRLQSANSLQSTSLVLAVDLLGPAVGGLIVAAVGTAAAFAIDAATFLASIAALAAIRPRRIVRDDAPAGILTDVREGIGYVIRAPWIWVTLVAVGTVGNFAGFGPLPVLVPLLVEDHLGLGADALGLVFAGYGVGGLAGVLLVGSRTLKLDKTVPAYLGWIGATVALGCLAFAPNALAAAAALAVAGFSGEIAEVVWVTLLQRHVPARLLGRVTSTDWLVSLSLQPLAVGLAAPLAGAVGVPAVFLGGAIVSITAMATAMAFPAVRTAGAAET